MNPLSTTLSSVPEFALTLDVGATRALESSLPVRLWYADDDHFAEVFFFRDLVLHAELDGLFGVPAIIAMLTSDVRFAVDVGVWPRECTIAFPWTTTRRAAEHERARVHHARHDDEPTERIAER